MFLYGEVYVCISTEDVRISTEKRHVSTEKLRVSAEEGWPKRATVEKG